MSYVFCHALDNWQSCEHHSPNLPYSKGMGSYAAAIRFLKVVYREKLSIGKLQCTAGAPFKDHNNKPVLISCASIKMYSHGGFDRCFGCTLEFPSAELFPLHNFQKADCRCQWAYSFGVGEVWWMVNMDNRFLSMPRKVSLKKTF